MNSEYKSALFLSIKIGYLSSFQKQAANSLVTETLQYFVFFCRPAYSAILVKCLIINVLRFILAIPFFTAFLNITYQSRHSRIYLGLRLQLLVYRLAKQRSESQRYQYVQADQSHSRCSTELGYAAGRISHIQYSGRNDYYCQLLDYLFQRS